MVSCVVFLVFGVEMLFGLVPFKTLPHCSLWCLWFSLSFSLVGGGVRRFTKAMPSPCLFFSFRRRRRLSGLGVLGLFWMGCVSW